MTLRRVRIQLHDEAPRIGSGWRPVDILSEGHKWTTVRCPHTSNRHRFRKDLWQAITKTMKEETP